ncbi:hypothetical protein PsYK624_026240 [Phanerochaete sordida]|uniref:Heterokaryon incompatibility domain-containing protein n=1 Tax=Phanerochaete sordida TaxID=48140 RepID=A0A9P3L9H9_9APHY|nr:hypothetical protein PsYK624_026240 [Phanerochaete sordida]
MSTSEITHEALLQNLNSVLGTAYTVQEDGLEDCLSRALDTDIRDFGEAYALLRPWWSTDFSTALAGMAKRKNDDELLRRGALGNEFIHDPWVPPRRVWDLHSNRVVPFYFLRPDALGRPEEIPSNVWFVTHNQVWLDVPRGSIVTSINGRRWPVALPKDTSLNHIRVELLNMGAEYVWLDVLCLRSGFGGETNEEERARSEELQLDIPTTGYMFQSWDRPCVAYFNGLGLPLERLPPPTASDSASFWANILRGRLTGHWLPGGLTASRPWNGDAFFAQVEDTMRILSRPVGDDERMRFVIQELQRLPRNVMADEPMALPYLLGCPTIPVDCTWDQLVEHLPPLMRTELCLRYPVGRHGALWPSVDTICKRGPSISYTRAGITDREQLRYHDSVQEPLHGTVVSRYFHDGYVTSPCRISERDDDSNSLDIRFDAAPFGPVTVNITGSHGKFRPDFSYQLVAVGEQWKEYWIVVEVVGTRQVKNATALEAVKWGVFGTDEEAGNLLVALNVGQPRIRVVYLESTYEVWARSAMQRNS